MSQFFNTSPSLDIEGDQHSFTAYEQHRYIIEQGLLKFRRQIKLKNMATIVNRKRQENLRHSWCRLNSLNRLNEFAVLKINKVFVYWDTHSNIYKKRVGLAHLKHHLKQERIKQLKIQYLLSTTLQNMLYERYNNFFRALKNKRKCLKNNRQIKFLQIKAVKSISNIVACYLSRHLQTLLFKIRMKAKKQIKNIQLKRAYAFFHCLKSIQRSNKKIFIMKLSSLDKFASQKQDETDEDSPTILDNALKCVFFIAKRQYQRQIGFKQNNDANLKQKRLKILLLKEQTRERDAKMQCLKIWNRKLHASRFQILKEVKRLQEIKERFIQSNF